MKKKIIGFVMLFAVSLMGMLIYNHIKYDNSKVLADSTGFVIRKSDYTLDDLYNYIKDNDYIDYYKHPGIGYTYAHFYDYFSQDTLFLVISDYDEKNNKVLATKYISYDEYMEFMQPMYEKLETQEIGDDDNSVWFAASWALINGFM